MCLRPKVTSEDAGVRRALVKVSKCTFATQRPDNGKEKKKKKKRNTTTRVQKHANESRASKHAHLVRETRRVSDLAA